MQDDRRVPDPSSAEPSSPPAWRGWLAQFMALLRVGIWVAALYGLHREWSAFHFADLTAAFAHIGPELLALSFVLAALSYLCNAAVGLMAERWLGRRLHEPWRDLAVSYISSAFTMNAGGTVLGGGSIRMRFAAARGQSVVDIGKITLFTGVTSWAGHALLCGLLLCVAPPPLTWLPVQAGEITGVALVVASLAMAFAGILWRGKWPGPALAVPTLLISAVDWLLAGLALRVLIPGPLPFSTWSFVVVVVLAQAAASSTHVPGGVGVLEIAITKALSALIAAPVLAGALVMYRLLYYLLPFCVAIVLLGVREIRVRAAAGLAKPRALRGWSVVAPRLAALLALGGGFMLLLSANTPVEEARRSLLQGLLPLPFVEASHFASSLAGTLLLVLARGLQRRIRTAWWLASALMAGGLVFSLLKGFDWEEALALSFMLSCLLPFRSYFHRQAALWSHRFTFGWWLLILSLMTVSVWLGFFAARHVPYQHDLWWQFTFKGDASRFLRAVVGSGCIFVVIALAQALRPARKRLATVVDPRTVEDLVRRSSHTDAALAFLDDKDFTLAEDGRCGLMHADQGRSRIVMGDPLGDSAAADEMLWRFVEQAQDEGMKPVFYQVSVDEMPRLVDMGFKLFKLGEEAHVALETFSLDGAAARKLRQTRNRFQHAGLVFAIWEPAEVAARMEALRAVSDAWLAERGAAQKGFSMGFFDETYLRRFPCGVVLTAAGEVIAFANILATDDREALSVDLMRYLPTAPNGVMEAMFIELMLWGRAQGYKYFNLGMAPLSGLSTHALAPLWNKLAAGVFQRGEALYHFQGLRSYKDKFSPEWKPRYIAVQSIWGLTSALVDATALIGGGLRKVLTRRKS